MSSPVSRETIRKKLAADMAVYLTRAARVDNHQKSDLGDDMPVVRVISAGAIRPQTIAAGRRSKFKFTIQLFVQHSEVDGVWTNSDAEDALDALEQQVADYVSDNQNIPDFWTHLAYDDSGSVVYTAKQNSIVWLVEDINVVVEVYG